MEERYQDREDEDEDDDGDDDDSDLDYHGTYQPESLRDSSVFGTPSSPISIIDGDTQQVRPRQRNLRHQPAVQSRNNIKRYSQSLPNSRLSNSDQDEDGDELLQRGSDSILRQRHLKQQSPDYHSTKHPTTTLHAKPTNKAYLVHRQGNRTPSSVDRVHQHLKRQTPLSASKPLHKRGSLKEGLTIHDEEINDTARAVPLSLSPPNSPSKRFRSPIERSSSENHGIFFSNDNNEGASATDYNDEFMFEDKEDTDNEGYYNDGCDDNDDQSSIRSVTTSPNSTVLRHRRQRSANNKGKGRVNRRFKVASSKLRDIFDDDLSNETLSDSDDEEYLATKQSDLVERMRLLAAHFQQKLNLKRFYFNKWRSYTERVVHHRRKEVMARNMKRENIRKAFLAFTGISAASIILVLLFYAYQMIESYLRAFFWAILFTSCLSMIKDKLLYLVLSLDEQLRDYKLKIIGCYVLLNVVLFCTYVISSYVIAISSLYLAGMLIAGIIFILVTVLERHTLVSMFIVVMLIMVITFPLYWLFQTCVQESKIASMRVAQFVENNEEFQKLIENYEDSEMYRSVKRYAESWGWDLADFSLPYFKTQLVTVITWFGNNSARFFGTAIEVASNLSSFFFSIIVFISSLFYFLASKDDIIAEMGRLSPFDSADNEKLKESIRNSITRTFLCSLLVGLLHGCTTFISFSLSGIELKVIFSLLSGFLATLPILSSWIIWIPACLWLYMVGRLLESLLVFIAHVAATYWANPLIYSYIPGANSYFVGLSIVMGITAFGVMGALLGPLIIGTLVTLKDIYISYMLSLPMDDQQVPQQRQQRPQLQHHQQEVHQASPFEFASATSMSESTSSFDNSYPRSGTKSVQEDPLLSPSNPTLRSQSVPHLLPLS